MATRGVKNNNWGNLIKTNIKWQGETEGNDPRFETFEKPEYGIRALYLNLNSYLKKNKNTIEKIVNSYAPSTENNTIAYIKNLSKYTGKKSNEIVSVSDLKKLIQGIVIQENGYLPLSFEDVWSKAMNLISKKK